MKARLISLILAVAVLFAGCGKETELSAKYKKDGLDKATIRYSFWGSSDQYEKTVKSIKRFEELYPDIKVNIEYSEWGEYKESVTKKLSEGKGADVMMIDFSWVNIYSKDGDSFYDLNTLSDSIDLTAFDGAKLTFGEMGGKLLALPVSFDSSVPLYNEKIFSSFGLSTPASIEDLRMCAQIMRTKNVYPLGMDKWQTVLFVYTLKQQGIAMKYALKEYKELVDAKCIQPLDSFSSEKVKVGRVAGVICPESRIAIYDELIKENGGNTVVGIEVEGGARGIMSAYIKPSSMLAIKKDTKNPIEAATLLNYLLSSEENAEITNYMDKIPASKNAEMYLMGFGTINEAAYVATVATKLHMNELSKTPIEFANEAYVDRFIEILYQFVNMEIDIDEATELIENITE